MAFAIAAAMPQMPSSPTPFAFIGDAIGSVIQAAIAGVGLAFMLESTRRRT